ncbi:hypothetical protein [Aliikangiella sp. G2MR2-5]|uniref:hypothetical protein n=1 Tax=Aliikangiella sp. G2MR2-5 TaxID=2788943 RepID=UPI0018AB5A0D|nr:hypothetical protein [Aliikangiella sp. G2MR2-5]
MKTINIVSVLFLLVHCSLANANEKSNLKPFTSDGCSSFPDGTIKHRKLWLECCVAHDKAYWLGGSYQQRKKADEELKQCVEQVGEKQIAKLMLAGVRVGGSPFWPTSFRWGYGWDYPRGYKIPTEAEKTRAKNLLEAYEVAQHKLDANDSVDKDLILKPVNSNSGKKPSF